VSPADPASARCARSLSHTRDPAALLHSWDAECRVATTRDAQPAWLALADPTVETDGEPADAADRGSADTATEGAVKAEGAVEDGGTGTPAEVGVRCGAGEDVAGPDVGGAVVLVGTGSERPPPVGPPAGPPLVWVPG
jgi:hypothetical protein